MLFFMFSPNFLTILKYFERNEIEKVHMDVFELQQLILIAQSV